MEIDPNDPGTWPQAALAFLRRRERGSIGSRELVDRIRERIGAAGPMPFAEFMRLALYHPEYGYYTTPGPRIGPEGDFLTAPETHPAFGALVCRRIVALWEGMGRPAHFEVVEGGPGTGILAWQILGYARARYPDFHAAQPDCKGRSELQAPHANGGMHFIQRQTLERRGKGSAARVTLVPGFQARDKRQALGHLTAQDRQSPLAHAGVATHGAPT
jgi:hypothetical protein